MIVQIFSLDVRELTVARITEQGDPNYLKSQRGNLSPNLYLCSPYTKSLNDLAPILSSPAIQGGRGFVHQMALCVWMYPSGVTESMVSDHVYKWYTGLFGTIYLYIRSSLSAIMANACSEVLDSWT